MSAKKSGGKPFTSFRIISEKAQRLFSKARELKSGGAGKQSTRLPPPEQYNEVLVHISLESVVKATFAIFAIIAGLTLIHLLQETIVLFFLAVFVATIMDPGVKALNRMGVPRGIGILLHYLVALALLMFLVISLIPIIAKQVTDIADLINLNANAFLQNPSISLPLVADDVNVWLTHFLESTLRNLNINHFADALQAFGQTLSTTAQGTLELAAHVAGSVVNFVFSLILVLVLAFFIQIEKEKIAAWSRSFLPWKYRGYLDDKAELIQEKIGQWARGQLVLCFSIGLFVFLALTIMRMPYALTLAILAGFTEVIPYVGPLIAAVPAVLIAVTQQGLLWGVAVAVVYYVIQWCENNLLVPLIMKRAVGLSAVAIMLAMLVGVSFPDVIHPVLGIILSIPITTILALFLDDWRSSPPRS
jgi:predicted PurR-regulated permease PerM